MVGNGDMWRRCFPKPHLRYNLRQKVTMKKNRASGLLPQLRWKRRRHPFALKSERTEDIVVHYVQGHRGTISWINTPVGSRKILCRPNWKASCFCKIL